MSIMESVDGNEETIYLVRYIMKQQVKNNNDNDSLVKDLQELKLTIEIMKRQIAELEKKHTDKDEIQKLALADARELFEMRNNR